MVEVTPMFYTSSWVGYDYELQKINSQEELLLLTKNLLLKCRSKD